MMARPAAMSPAAMSPAAAATGARRPVPPSVRHPCQPFRLWVRARQEYLQARAVPSRARTLGLRWGRRRGRASGRRDRLRQPATAAATAAGVMGAAPRPREGHLSPKCRALLHPPPTVRSARSTLSRAWRYGRLPGLQVGHADEAACDGNRGRLAAHGDGKCVPSTTAAMDGVSTWK